MKSVTVLVFMQAKKLRLKTFESEDYHHTNISLAANFNTDEISNIVFRVNDTSLTQHFRTISKKNDRLQAPQQGE